MSTIFKGLKDSCPNVGYYQSTLRNIPEQQRPHLHRVESLKSRVSWLDVPVATERQQLVLTDWKIKSKTHSEHVTSVTLCVQIATHCDIPAYLTWLRGLKTMRRPNGTSSSSLIVCTYRLYHLRLPIASNQQAFRMSRKLYHKIIDRLYSWFWIQNLQVLELPDIRMKIQGCW
jgi:hypothetical protein